SWMVHAYRARNALQQMQPVDFAKPVVFENWVDQNERLARVHYRDAIWEAQVEAGVEVEAGATLYIVSTDGNTLKVVKSRPKGKQK
ncbi:MAG: NfeD family protein, partial [Gammaproteobacteria bacterium]